MRQLEWLLIQSDQCPYNKRSVQEISAQRDNHVKQQQEGGHLQVKKRGLRRSQPANTSISGLPTSRTVRKDVLLLKPPSWWYFVIAAWAAMLLLKTTPLMNRRPGDWSQAPLPGTWSRTPGCWGKNVWIVFQMYQSFVDYFINLLVER